MGPSSVPGTSNGTTSPEDQLDKMIQQQNRMFTLEIKKEMAKEEHEDRKRVGEGKSGG
jgi:hypothetical protein